MFGCLHFLTEQNLGSRHRKAFAFVQMPVAFCSFVRLKKKKDQIRVHRMQSHREILQVQQKSRILSAILGFHVFSRWVVRKSDHALLLSAIPAKFQYSLVSSLRGSELHCSISAANLDLGDWLWGEMLVHGDSTSIQERYKNNPKSRRSHLLSVAY